MPRPYHNVEKYSAICSRIAERWRFPGRINMLLWSPVWRETVGDMIADHVRPLHLKRKVLTLAVESSSWMNEIQLHIPEILQRLQTRLGEKKIETIKLKQMPFTKPPETVKKTALSFPPLDPIDQERVEKMVSPIRDDQVRAAVRSSYSRFLQRRLHEMVEKMARLGQTSSSIDGAEENE